jgi:hypothetical protein
MGHTPEDTALIASWLSEHKPRRFEVGTSATPDALREYLKGHGYELGFTGWRGGQKATLKHTGMRGRPPTMTMRELLAFVDELRLTDGLQPILKPDSDIERELALEAA